MSDHIVVDVVSDIVCPWCYIGKRRLEGASAILGHPIEIRWHPFELNPGIPPEGITRREYRTAKFGSWEYSQRLDARVAENGKQAGIIFRHDRMERTPNSFRGHALMAAALRQGTAVQNRVAERIFSGYFTNGEDVGDTRVLASIAQDCGVDSISTPEDLDDATLTDHVRGEERKIREAGVQGVPLIRFQGEVVSEGAAPEEMLAARLRELSADHTRR
jgi:predicted DsbA family dithiol-disulfide isomerase